MSDTTTTGRPGDPTWKRWEMSAFDAPAAPAADKQSPLPSAAQVRAQIERLQEAARTRGHAEGYAAGHAQGLAAGKQEGISEGRKQGYDDGSRSGQDHARQTAQDLQALVTACADAIASVENEMGQALMSLAVNIAEQVLRSTLVEHPEKILDLVRDVTHLDTGKEAVLRLRVNPADMDLVQPFLNSDPATSHWRLLPDASITRGGCVAVTALGDIDATLQTRWQRVTSVLGQGSRSLTGAA